MKKILFGFILLLINSCSEDRITLDGEVSVPDFEFQAYETPFEKFTIDQNYPGFLVTRHGNLIRFDKEQLEDSQGNTPDFPFEIWFRSFLTPKDYIVNNLGARSMGRYLITSGVYEIFGIKDGQRLDVVFGGEIQLEIRDALTFDEEMSLFDLQDEVVLRRIVEEQGIDQITNLSSRWVEVDSRWTRSGDTLFVDDRCFVTIDQTLVPCQVQEEFDESLATPLPVYRTSLNSFRTVNIDKFENLQSGASQVFFVDNSGYEGFLKVFLISLDRNILMPIYPRPEASVRLPLDESFRLLSIVDLEDEKYAYSLQDITIESNMPFVEISNLEEVTETELLEVMDSINFPLQD